MTRIGLAMMVKNEAPRIVRALDSARPFIDFALVTDTGSTDGTQDIVRRWLGEHGVPSEVREVEWRDYGWNRSRVLELMGEHNVDYALMLDGDEILEGSLDRASLSAPCYDLVVRESGKIGQTCLLPRLTSNRVTFVYRGVVHEFLDAPPGPLLEGPSIVSVLDDKPRRDPSRYRREAELLTAALAKTDDIHLKNRYAFYLAQSWKNCGELKKALAAYIARARLGGWIEEVYVSIVMAARLRERLGEPLEQTLRTYQAAIALNPKRLEAVHGAARACRLAGRYEDGRRFAMKGVGLPLWRGLFAEPWIWRHGLNDELSICAARAGQGAVDG